MKLLKLFKKIIFYTIDVKNLIAVTYNFTFLNFTINEFFLEKFLFRKFAK
jgi:hypothetical protein